MFNFLKVHEKYEIRHLILSNLLSKAEYDDNHYLKLQDTLTDLQVIADEINVPFAKVLQYHHALNTEKGKYVCCTSKDSKHFLVLLPDGIDAVIDEFWRREGRKELNERIYDKTKWVVPVIALVVTIGSILYSATKVQGLQEKVEKARSQIETLQQQIAHLSVMP